MTDDNPWPFRAACTTTSPETDHWYAPTKLPGGKIEGGKAKKKRLAIALAACDTCPVRRECADAGRDEEHGIWGGIDKSSQKREPTRPTRRTPEQNRAVQEKASAAKTARANAAFDEFVETITTLHRAGATLREVLEYTGYDDRQVFYNRLHRRGRLDLYSMLTGAAA